MHHFTGEMRDWFRHPSWFVVRNVATDTSLDGEARHIHLAEGLISSISVPVMLPSNDYGFLLIGFRQEHEFNDADIRFARSMGQTIAAAL
jgi:GAF domain-containing protein